MFFDYQRTIKNSVSCFGIGLHCGRAVSMKLIPAVEDTGIVFKRVDIADKVKSEIKADYNSVSNTTLCTTISNQYGVTVATIEHLMAALWGCGIDNLIIEINGPEVPIMDGSSEPFVFLLECAGYQEQTKARKIIEVVKEFELKEGNSSVVVKPAPEFAITMEIEFDNKVIASQTLAFDSRDFSFKMDICRARTFGFAHEVEKLRELGLALGGSLENAVVIKDNIVLNEGGLRYKDEFVRHKMLDFIGDFYLGGAHVKGHFHCVRTGHALNNKLLRKLFTDQEAWRLVEFNNGTSENNNLRYAS